MLHEAESRDEWSAGFHLLLARELQRGARRGFVTSAEAQQLTARFLVLLDQALDLPALRPAAPTRNPWDWAAS